MAPLTIAAQQMMKAFMVLRLHFPL
jgi:hypothetical protein